MLRIHQLTYRIGPMLALDHLDLELTEGACCVIIGSNGAGKSTLMRWIAGDLPPGEGSLWIDGTDVTNQDRSGLVAFVPQDIQQATVGELSVRENIVLAARRGQSASWSSWRGLDGPCEALLAIMQKGSLPWENDWLDRPMDSLSGGQRQMVAVTMACVSRPRLLLLDEHTAALDPRAQKAVMQATMEQLRHHGTTTLMVTHQLDHALAWGDRLLMLHRGRLVLDVAGEAKKALTLDGVLELFHRFDYETCLDLPAERPR